MRQNFFIRRRLLRFSLHLALELAEHEEFIRFGLFATAIDFQIAQDQRAFAVALQKNERIGRPKLRRVKHIRVGFAGRDDEAGFATSDFGFRDSGFFLHLAASPFKVVSPDAMYGAYSSNMG